MGISDVDLHENVQDTVYPNLESGQTSVGTSATALNGGTSLEVPPGTRVKVNNESSNSASIYVGGSGVTTSDGYEIDVGEDVELRVDDVSTIHVVAASTGYTVSWLVEQT